MEVRKGYKQTEAGVIPDTWQTRIINHLLEDETILGHLDGNHGALYPRSWEFKLNGVPYIGANDFLEGFVSFKQCKYLSKERADQFNKGVARNGDVLFAHNATVGPVALLITNYEFVILSTTATYFRCDNEKLNNIFLKYALQSRYFIKQYTSVMSQSTRFQVPITTQRKFYLVIPPIQEQRAIADTMSDVDSLLTALDSLIAKKRLVKQGAMQELLTGKRRLVKSGEWKVKRLGDVLTLRYGKSQRDVITNDGKYPIIATSGEVGRTNQYLYDKPSVIIGRKGTIDKPQYIDIPFWTIDTAYYSEISEQANPKFLFYLLTTINWYSYNEASGVPSLNAKTVENIEISFPPLAEQQAIAEILSDMDAEINALESRREKTRQLKAGMMSELLTGRIRLL